MGQSHHVEEEIISRKPDPTLPVRPAQELFSFVGKGIRFENAFFTVTDGTGNHAVVAANAGGKLLQERFREINVGGKSCLNINSI